MERSRGVVGADELDLEDGGKQHKPSARSNKFKTISKSRVCLLMMLVGTILGSVFCQTKCAPSAVNDNAQREKDLDEKLFEKYMLMYGDESAARRAVDLHRLRTWFLEQGGHVHPNVELRPHPDNLKVWGFFATGDIQDNEVVVAAPQHLFITAYTATAAVCQDIWALKDVSSLPKDQVTPKLVMETMGFVGKYHNMRKRSDLSANSLLNDLPNAIIAVYILVFRRLADHFFQPFFKTLPTECQNTVCWPEQKLRQTFQPAVVASILEGRTAYVGVAERLGLNISEFLNVVSVVNTRYWNDPTMKYVATMVPFADMINHPVAGKHAVFATFASRTLSGAYVLNDKLTTIGEEVYCSYGRKHNGKMLRNYGFTYPMNPDDDCKALESYLTLEYIAKHIILPDGVQPCRLPEVQTPTR